VNPKTLCTAACLAALMQPAAQPLYAAEIELTVQIPRHKERPYVAIWIEDEHRDIVRHLAVWHEGGRPGGKKSKKGKKKNDKYLKDLSTWWRAGGRNEDMPIDGVSGPTRPAGTHTLHFPADARPLGQLQAGDYHVVVEASREDGGDELIRLPLPWPPQQAHSASGQGRRELREVTLRAVP